MNDIPAATETESLKAKARTAMTRARAKLVLDHPFFGSLALRLNLAEDENCRDLWTDGKTLACNPLYACALSEDKLVGAQAHEIMHLACRHNLRRGAREEGMWNKACDLAINQILLESGFSLPEGFTFDPKYSGRSVDDIYAALLRLREEEARGGAKNSMPDGESDSAEFSDGARGGAGEDEDGNDNGGAADGENHEKGTLKANGGALSVSGEAGNQHLGEMKNFQGEVRDHPTVSEKNERHSRENAEREAEISVQQAAQRALNMGDVPAGLSRFLRKIAPPPLDWRELLRRFLENCRIGDYSWSQPNRRYLFQNIYLPSMLEPRLPELVLAVDSSGSVDEDALARFCSELSSILENFDTTLSIFFHDTQVYEGPTLTRQDLPFRLTPTGGGGTDYRPVGAHLKERELNPAALLWFTDLECDRFPEEPEFPVLWAVTGGKPESGASTLPPFGELVYLD